MKFFLLIIAVFISVSFNASAQYTYQKDAMYLATIKAVADYKIDDKENIKNIEALRSNKRFLQELRSMISKLSNNKNKNSTNNKVYKILINAGKEIYNELK